MLKEVFQLLDTLVMYEFNKLPLMQLDDVSATLPSRDDLWENPNAGSIEPLSKSSLML